MGTTSFTKLGMVPGAQILVPPDSNSRTIRTEYTCVCVLFELPVSMDVGNPFPLNDIYIHTPYISLSHKNTCSLLQTTLKLNLGQLFTVAVEVIGTITFCANSMHVNISF